MSQGLVHYRESDGTFQEVSNSKPLPVTSAGGGGSASGGGLSTYYAKPSGSNADATSAYASATTLTVTGLPYSFTKYDIVSVRQIPNSGGSGAQDTVFTDVADFSVSGNTITVANASFAATDEFVVAFALPPKSIDSVNNAQDVQAINPDYHRNLGVISHVASAQDFTASFADLGSEINCKGYKYLYYYITLDINSTQNARIKFLAKHTAGGSDEYKIDHNQIECPATTVSAVAGSEDSYLEFDNDQDDLYCIKVPILNGLPYIQPQIEAGTVGATAGQIDEAYYTLGY